MRRLLTLATAFLLAGSAPAAGQEAGAAGPATIVVGAAGSVELTADHAVVVLGVEVRDSVAARAAREMDRRLAAVADTLDTLGFPWDSLPSAGFGVRPESRRSYETQTFEARSSVEVTVRELDQLDDVITAALAAGANSVSRLDFRSSEEPEGRRRALAEAVAAAREDAGTLAEAAGVELGEILEIRTGTTGRNRYLGAVGLEAITVRGSTPSTPLTPRSITVHAQVEIAWAIRP